LRRSRPEGGTPVTATRAALREAADCGKPRRLRKQGRKGRILWRGMAATLWQGSHASFPAARRSMSDAEAAGVFERRDVVDAHFADVVGERAFLGDVFEEGVDFVGFAHGLQFDRAVGEVPDRAADVEACGDLPDGEAEADALDAAFIDDAFCDHVREEWITGRGVEASPDAALRQGGRREFRGRRSWRRR